MIVHVRDRSYPDTAISFHFEARRNDLLLFAEYQYVSLDPSIEANLGPIPVDASIDFTVRMAEVGAGYTVSKSERTRWEILGGWRRPGYRWEA
jgi:hypothetical protein